MPDIMTHCEHCGRVCEDTTEDDDETGGHYCCEDCFEEEHED